MLLNVENRSVLNCSTPNSDKGEIVLEKWGSVFVWIGIRHGGLCLECS